jgi:hypothetical protein
MCLEGMLTKAVSSLPGGKYVSGFISAILLCIALFLAMRSQQPMHFLFACCCPCLYILYHFATQGSRKNISSASSNNTDLSS